MPSRFLKRAVIGAVYLAIILGLAASVYFAFLKTPETCTDGKQNQNESGIDCGGVCANACQERLEGEALAVKEAGIVPAGAGVYDVIGQVYNPNDSLGASVFSYAFELRDASGQVIATRSGKSFILPQETKSLLELNIPVSSTPVSVTLVTSGITWERFTGYQAKPQISIYQRRYNQISGGAGFGEALGLVVNESPFDFRAITVKVILRDRDGKPLALNETQMNTVRSKEERDFRLVWPAAFPGTVEEVDMEADADIYHSDNFLRQYLPGGEFQSLGQ